MSLCYPSAGNPGEIIGTKNGRKTARGYTTDDFRKLRKSMGWKWEDINAITGLTVARTNITKGLPAWVNLALEVQRRTEQRLQLGVVDAIVQRPQVPFKFSAPVLKTGRHL